MTDRIEEIRARCEKATQGPWHWDVIDAHKCIHLISTRWMVMDFVRYGMSDAAPRFLVDGIMKRADDLLKSIPGKEHHIGFDNYIDHPDADFIARSREDIPYLLSQIAERDNEIERLREAVAWIPVTERLPDTNKPVQVYMPKLYMSVQTGFYDRYYGEDDGEWYEHWVAASEVTHWKSLPTPPEETNAD